MLKKELIMCALPTPKSSPITREVSKIKGKIDVLITKMQNDAKVTPTRSQLEDYAESLLSFIDRYHEEVAEHKSYLKAAIIDLTEVPQMAPQMQRIAFLTALKDASHEIELFLSCY